DDVVVVLDRFEVEQERRLPLHPQRRGREQSCVHALHAAFPQNAAGRTPTLCPDVVIEVVQELLDPPGRSQAGKSRDLARRQPEARSSAGAHARHDSRARRPPTEGAVGYSVRVPSSWAVRRLRRTAPGRRRAANISPSCRSEPWASSTGTSARARCTRCASASRARIRSRRLRATFWACSPSSSGLSSSSSRSNTWSSCCARTIGAKGESSHSCLACDL